MSMICVVITPDGTVVGPMSADKAVKYLQSEGGQLSPLLRTNLENVQGIWDEEIPANSSSLYVPVED